MSREELLQAIGSIDDDLILRAKEKKRKRAPLWIKLGAAAACLLIAAAILPYSSRLLGQKSMNLAGGSAANQAVTGSVQENAAMDEECGENPGEAEYDSYAGLAYAQAPVLIDGNKSYFLTEDSEILSAAGIGQEASEAQAGEYVGNCGLTGEETEYHMLSDGQQGYPVYRCVDYKGEAVRLVQTEDGWQYALFNGFLEDGSLSSLFAVYGIEESGDILSIGAADGSWKQADSLDEQERKLFFRFYLESQSANEKHWEDVGADNLSDGSLSESNGEQEAYPIFVENAEHLKLYFNWYPQEQVLLQNRNSYCLSDSMNSLLIEISEK